MNRITDTEILCVTNSCENQQKTPARKQPKPEIDSICNKTHKQYKINLIHFIGLKSYVKNKVSLLRHRTTES